MIIFSINFFSFWWIQKINTTKCWGKNSLKIREISWMKEWILESFVHIGYNNLSFILNILHWRALAGQLTTNFVSFTYLYFLSLIWFGFLDFLFVTLCIAPKQLGKNWINYYYFSHCLQFLKHFCPKLFTEKFWGSPKDWLENFARLRSNKRVDRKVI